MDVSKTIQKRVTIRRWKPMPVEKEKIVKVLEAGRWAPSWGNVQPWRYIVVQGKVRIGELAKVAGGQPHISTAPVVIVCCGLMEAFSQKMHRESLKQLIEAGVMDWPDEVLDNVVLGSDLFAPYRLGEQVMTIKAGEQIMISLAYMTLEAVNQGLGSCWMGAISPKDAHQVMNLPKNLFVHDFFLLGYPDENPKPRPRKEFDKIVFWEKYKWSKSAHTWYKSGTEGIHRILNDMFHEMPATANTKGGRVMAVLKPLSKGDAAASVHGLYNAFTQKFGFMPNIFAAMAHRPEALSSFIPFFQLMMGEGTLMDRDKQLAYLATSLLNGCEYWTRARIASAKQAGVTDEQFKDLLFYQRSKAFDEKDKTTLHFVQLVTRAASAVRENILEELRRYYDEKQIVELTLIICLANFTNRFNDALQLIPDLG